MDRRPVPENISKLKKGLRKTRDEAREPGAAMAPIALSGRSRRSARSEQGSSRRGISETDGISDGGVLDCCRNIFAGDEAFDFF